MSGQIKSNEVRKKAKELDKLSVSLCLLEQIVLSYLVNNPEFIFTFHLSTYFCLLVSWGSSVLQYVRFCEFVLVGKFKECSL